MKTVTVTLKFEFETEDSDNETLVQLISDAFEERVDNDDLLLGAKIKVVEHEAEEDDEPEFEDEDEE